MSGLGLLYDAVVSDFAANGEGTVIVFGEREKTKQLNQAHGSANRIVFEPCDGDTIADVLPARGGVDTYDNEFAHVGRLEEKATLYVWAADLTAIGSERAQYDAARVLFGKLYVSLWKAAAGRIAFGKVARSAEDTKTERRYGAEWKMVITIRDDMADTMADMAHDLIANPTFVFTGPEGSIED